MKSRFFKMEKQNLIHFYTDFNEMSIIKSWLAIFRCLELRQNKPKSSGPSAAKKQKRDHCKYGCNSNGLEVLHMSAMTTVLDVEDLFKL